MTTASSARPRAARPVTWQHWVNLFPLAEQGRLSLAYRLVEIGGLPQDEHYPKNLNLLIKRLSYQLRSPVAVVTGQERACLAVPAQGVVLPEEVQLTPYVARLAPGDARHLLHLGALTRETLPIAIRFLEFSLRGPLMRHPNLWSTGRSWFEKAPLDGLGSAELDLYPGFNWRVVATGDNRLHLALDCSTRYVERAWMVDRYDAEALRALERRHVLYHFGDRWFPVQFWGLTGEPIGAQRFQPPGGDAIDVYTYTLRQCGGDRNPRLRDLDPQDPAILFRYPRKEEQRFGALSLCKRLVRTDEPAARALHGRTTLSPQDRRARIAATVEQYFAGGELGGQPIAIAPAPLQVERRIFPVPAFRFGRDYVLAVERGRRPPMATPGETVGLADLGRRRLALLRSPAGPLTPPTDAAHFLLQPLSLDRAINDDFADRFVGAMTTWSGRADYRPRRVLYDDRGCQTLAQHLAAIHDALRPQDGHGYGLLVLPANAPRDLHNYLKSRLWPRLQFQCATATGIARHYRASPRGTAPARHAWAVDPRQEGRYQSYARQCALGMLVVSRQWPWALATPLNHDLHVGIDVLNRTAGLTIIADGGRAIRFHDFACRRAEQLTRDEVEKELAAVLREELPALPAPPRSLVIHRDGRTFSSVEAGQRDAPEVAGALRAVRQLQGEGLLPRDLALGVVDIRKTSADGLRLFAGTHADAVENPPIGSWWALGPSEGIVCTTGWPATLPGTARPLKARLIWGRLDLAAVLEDIFALAQLTFTAPDKFGRLPLTIKLADDFLEPIAGRYDEAAEREGREGETALDDEVAAGFAAD